MHKIEVCDLTKKYGEVMAVDHVTLTFEEGKIYGLLGRNGAGKSTLIGVINNRIFATEGKVLINGIPAYESDAAQANVYMMSEKNYYPDNMRITDVFKWTNTFYQGAFRMEYALSLCDLFGLNPKKRVKQLSTGYSSIYKIITALSLTVPFLLLDEPVLGLDAYHRDLLYKVILENYAELSRTIVISTHLIEEISSLIEEVIIIKSGKIITQSPIEQLLSSGYTVTGPTDVVNTYVQGKQKIGEDVLGGIKAAYMMGAPERDSLPEQLQVSHIDLQKLFIQLTNQ